METVEIRNDSAVCWKQNRHEYFKLKAFSCNVISKIKKNALVILNIYYIYIYIYIYTKHLKL
mgnify:CR=1 FL=1